MLDDIGRAREHGELTGGFKSVAESLEAAVAKLGLSSFGEDGEPFDPNVHEALMHSYSPDVTEPTCVRRSCSPATGSASGSLRPGAGRGGRAQRRATSRRTATDSPAGGRGEPGRTRD